MKTNNTNKTIIEATIKSALRVKTENTAIRGIVADAEKEMERTGRHWVVREIPINLIEVDTEYQRVPRNYEVVSINDEYDPDRVDVKVCSARKDENGVWHLYLIDGFHTLAVEIMRGQQNIYVKLFVGLTQQREAQLFARQKDGVTNIRGYERYRADLVAGDEPAITIKAVLDKYGLTVKNNTSTVINRYKNINSIEELYRIVKRYKNEGKEALDYVLEMIEKAGWSNGSKENKMAYTQRILGGLAGTYEICKDPIKKNLLLTYISHKTCEEFLAEAYGANKGDHYSDKVKNYCIDIANSCV